MKTENRLNGINDFPDEPVSMYHSALLNRFSFFKREGSLEFYR
ncbi:hypothetical protein HMPREF9554_03124 [Treponema phagedenis F0421]|nr:hypothetical protein HMPREF9554_03124 [Treponema phagedenis F0421]